MDQTAEMQCGLNFVLIQVLTFALIVLWRQVSNLTYIFYSTLTKRELLPAFGIELYSCKDFNFGHHACVSDY